MAVVVTTVPVSSAARRAMAAGATVAATARSSAPPNLLARGFALIHRPYRGCWAAAVTTMVDSGAAVWGSLVPTAGQHRPWVMDTGASTHMHSSDGILLSRLRAVHSSITVGNGARIPVTSRGSILTTNTSQFALNNVLVAPSIIHNLLSVRQIHPRQ
jgi:hypothetical protein